MNNYKQNKHEMQSPFIELGHPQCVLQRYNPGERMLSIFLKSFYQFLWQESRMYLLLICCRSF